MKLFCLLYLLIDVRLLARRYCYCLIGVVLSLHRVDERFFPIVPAFQLSQFESGRVIPQWIGLIRWRASSEKGRLHGDTKRACERIIHERPCIISARVSEGAFAEGWRQLRLL